MYVPFKLKLVLIASIWQVYMHLHNTGSQGSLGLQGYESRDPWWKVLGSRAPLIHFRAPFGLFGLQVEKGFGLSLHDENMLAAGLQRSLPPFGTLTI